MNDIQYGRRSSFYDFMTTLKDTYNKEYKGAIDDGTAPELTRIVTNDMTSNYYFTYKGDTLYIDQFELQEYFSDDDDESNDRYNESTLNDKVYALSEMGAALFNLI